MSIRTYCVISTASMATYVNSSPFQGGESVLLKRIKSPEFQPTIEFEEVLVKTLCKHLNNVDETRESVIHLGNYIECVLAVVDKDEKFIRSHFGKMENSFWEQLTTLQSIIFNFLILLAEHH